MYSTLMSGYCSMKRLALASTTCGSKAQPEKRTVWAAAAGRGARSVDRPRPAAVLARKRRRESVIMSLPFRRGQPLTAPDTSP